MKNKKTRKKILIAVICIVVAAAVGGSVWFFGFRGPKEAVFVYPFEMLGMTEYWGDSQESYGPVSTDRIQTIFLTETQTVTQIHVQQGQEVKKGDLLLEFDTTLSDLALERKRLEMEKQKLNLEDAIAELQRIRSLRPMVIPQPSPDDGAGDENLGPLLTDRYQISTNMDYDGSSQEKALICWLNSSAGVDSGLMEAIRVLAEQYQNANALLIPSSPSAPDGNPDEGGETPGEGGETPGEGGETPGEGGETPGEGGETPGEGGETPGEGGETPGEGGETPGEGGETPGEGGETPGEGGETPGEGGETPGEGGETPGEGGETPGEGGENPGEGGEPTPPEPFTVNRFYVVFKVTTGNRALAGKTTWQGLVITRDPSSGAFSFQFCDAVIPDHMLEGLEGEEEDAPEIDYGSGYTSAQLAQMRADQEKKIAELELTVKMAEADYKLMALETTDGKVYAKIDGVIVSLLDPEEALMTQQPVVKLSDGGGFYIEGFVSELEKDKLVIGQEVTVNDWNTGMTYTGTIDSLGDFPNPDGYFNGMGNPNATYYPFLVFVDGSADLQEGRYVSVMYGSGTAQNGIYLQNPFLRTEQGKSYVYVMGADGTLEKRYVKTGKGLWGSYTEILEGLTAEDLIAFPYGKTVKDGAPAQEGDRSDLYG